MDFDPVCEIPRFGVLEHNKKFCDFTTNVLHYNITLKKPSISSTRDLQESFDFIWPKIIGHHEFHK